MNQRIALLGISGVGKSTLISKLREFIPLVHLQASDLIKMEQAYRAQDPDSSESLRTGPIIDNQALMITAFHREASATNLPVVFDGHSVIDGRDGLIEIPASVFSELRVNAICFLGADPEEIAKRRGADLDRERPYRDIATLTEHQEIAQAAARRIANELNCSFIHITDGSVDALRELIK